MQKRNVTLSMPTGLIRRAKALASAQDKSLSELLRESLEEKVSEASGYRQARDRQLRILATGFDLGLRGEVTWSRDSVHERR
ncbi:MAG: CopG family transcriptional regulator [Deltaproteobacteria bacterium]|nr:MAG: CopG family transcriptional regulator [Deltaproteobacteria bacterium]